MNEIIESRKNEVKCFLEYYKNNISFHEYEHFDFKLLYLLPFRNCENLQEEINIFKNYLGIEIESFYDLIISICTKCYPDFDCSWIKDFLNKYKINDFFENGKDQVEIFIKNITILGKRTKNLPFEVNGNQDVREDLRLKYRFLDLRGDKLKNNLILRAKVLQYLRSQMIEQ